MQIHCKWEKGIRRWQQRFAIESQNVLMQVLCYHYHEQQYLHAHIYLLPMHRTKRT